MTDQPEALRLADELTASVGTQSTYSAMQQAAAELRRLQAERDAAVKAIIKHNNQCQSLCGNGDAEAYACGYRRHFEATGRRCPECPTNYKIEWPQDAAIAKATGGDK